MPSEAGASVAVIYRHRCRPAGAQGDGRVVVRGQKSEHYNRNGINRLAAFVRIVVAINRVISCFGSVPRVERIILVAIGHEMR